MYGKIVVFLLCFLVLGSCRTNKLAGNSDSIVVDAKKWSKKNGKVSYSDWTKCKAVTIDLLPGYKSVADENFSKYGGDIELKMKATGFFYAKKIENRWWIIDPEGYKCWHVGVSGVRPGNSDRNEKALISKFNTVEKWIVQTDHDLINMGFNGVGCWSDVPMVQYSNKQNSTSLSYTMIWNFYANYEKQRKSQNMKGMSFAVFDPEFESFCNEQAIKTEETNNDPNLLGHFSDNELQFSEKILDEYLSVGNENDSNYMAALYWLKLSGKSPDQINDSLRNSFLGFVADRYYKVVSSAIRMHDPAHMFLGSRLHGRPKHNEGIIKAAGRYADIISINYYGQWEPSQKHFDEWSAWTDRPILITEFYTKGDDSGLGNVSGAGWRVKTQNDRGVFYENFCLKLLQMNNCVGWHWFRYMDNDPTDKTADPSNSDSNKGIVDNNYQYYNPLINHMRLLNMNRYKLIKYFKKKEVIG
ncbi:MAG: agarase [Bacteroidales bacterium]